MRNGTWVACVVAAVGAGCRKLPTRSEDVGRPTAADVFAAIQAAPKPVGALVAVPPRPFDAQMPFAWYVSAAADDAKPGAPPAKPPEAGTMPEVEVTAPRGGAPPTQPPWSGPPSDPWGGTGEQRLVGPNQQPEWTNHRRFATTRAYVLTPWQVEVESWWKGKFPKSGDSEHLFQEEIEIGLPGRIQLDLYGNIVSAPGEDARYEGTQFEIRHALAPWNCIWGNPTLYAEWKFNRDPEPDAWEAKLLLAGDLYPHCHAGFNLFYERQTSGEEAIEIGATAAISWTVLDPCLSLGIEAQYERTTVKGFRDDPENEFLLGPSIQIRPTDRLHIDVVPLIGLTHDSPDLEIFVVFGIELGRGADSGGYSGPTSSRGR